MLGEMGWQRPLTEARLFTDWPTLVGREIAEHCHPESLRDGELRITAQSSAWATQIRLLSGKLTHRVNTQLGATVVVRLHVTGPVGPSWRHGPRSVPGARGPRDTYG
jgi:predicted nucleic acid-binding Zn ribbon protein